MTDAMESKTVSAHYGEEGGKKYLASQHELMKFGGWANRTKFEPYIKPTDAVLDFGCGAGYLLEQLDCAVKWGVEINPHAIPLAEAKGITVFTRTEDVPTHSVDVVISNHALEHTRRPLDEVSDLMRVLKPNGLLVIVVPCESIERAFVANDINHHLYTWSPMNLGHLLLETGWTVLDVAPYRHKWPPQYQRIAKYGGRGLFNVLGTIWSYCSREVGQIRAVAQKNPNL